VTRPTAPFELDPARPPPPPPPSPAPAADADDPPIAAEPADLPPRPGRWARRWFWGSLAAFLALILLWQAVEYLAALGGTHPWLAVPLLGLLLVAAVTGTVGFLDEWREIRRMRGRAEIRAEAERLAPSELHGAAGPLLERLAADLGRRRSLAEPLARWRRHGHDALSDGEQLRLFEANVLAPLDREAYRIVLASSRDIGVLTAFSPLGLLDGFLVLARTLAMLRAVARVYGVTPGRAGSLALLRRCLRNAALAGLADVLSQAAVEHVGASLLTLLSARAGQGAGNALLAAKLGLEAIRLTRPLPFIAEEPPSLRKIRTALLEAPLARPVPELAADRRREPEP
jgi:putative membrane protein